MWCISRKAVGAIIEITILKKPQYSSSVRILINFYRMRQSSPILQCSEEGDAIVHISCESMYVPRSNFPCTVTSNFPWAGYFYSVQSVNSWHSVINSSTTVKTLKKIRARRPRQEEFSVNISGFGKMICSTISKMKKSLWIP